MMGEILGELELNILRVRVIRSDNPNLLGWKRRNLDKKYNLPPNTCYWNIRKDEIIGYEKNYVILKRLCK